MRLAVLTPAFYLSFPILVPWAVTARPDFPGLPVRLPGGLPARVPAPGGSRSFLAAMARPSAILCRHNAVAAPAAIVLWLSLVEAMESTQRLFCAVAGALRIPVLALLPTSTGMLLLNLSGAKFGAIASPMCGMC